MRERGSPHYKFTMKQLKDKEKQLERSPARDAYPRINNDEFQSNHIHDVMSEDNESKWDILLWMHFVHVCVLLFEHVKSRNCSSSNVALIQYYPLRPRRAARPCQLKKIATATQVETCVGV
jgi:hypothetical protein